MATGIPRDLPPVYFRREDRLKNRVQTVEPERIIQMGIDMGTIVCFAGGGFISIGYQERSPILMIGGTFMFMLGATWPTPK